MLAMNGQRGDVRSYERQPLRGRGPYFMEQNARTDLTASGLVCLKTAVG